MKRKRIVFKELLWALLFVLAAGALLGCASRMLKPERTEYGAVWRAFLAEPEDSMDYLYLGSSYAYCDVSPAVIEQETGLSGYCMAGPEQTMSITYWYLRQCLETQSPRAVFIEASALHFARFQGFTQVNLAYMPMGVNRLGAALTAAEPGLRTGILFDLYFYHDRWTEITAEEALRALAPAQPDERRGFTAVQGTAENMDKAPFEREAQSGQVYLENLGWLRKTAALCQERGITPVVLFHPTCSRLPQEWYARIARDMEDTPGVLYFDLSAQAEACGLDPMRDYFDAGHLNEGGAHIFSGFLGRFMQQNVPALAPEA